MKRAVRTFNLIHLAVGTGGKKASCNSSDSEKDSLFRSKCILSFLCVDRNEGQWKPARDHAVFMWVETRNICNPLTFIFKVNHLCGGSKQSKFSHFRRYGTGAGNHLVKLALKKKKGGGNMK